MVKYVVLRHDSNQESRCYPHSLKAVELPQCFNNSFDKPNLFKIPLLVVCISELVANTMDSIALPWKKYVLN